MKLSIIMVLIGLAAIFYLWLPAGLRCSWDIASMVGYSLGMAIFIVPLFYYGTKRIVRVAQGKPEDKG